MQKLGFRQTITIGFMLFSMFFGAGNLIFPPLLGAQAGSNTVSAMIGLIITAVCFPILAVAAVAKHDNLVKLGSMIHPAFASVFTILICLMIGPFVAIPRTCSTSFEMAVAQFLQVEGEAGLLLPRVLYSMVFFAGATFVALHPNKLKDILGRIMTPILVVLIVVTFVAAFTKLPVNVASAATIGYQESPIMTGFMTGYQTMDILAALNFGLVIAANLEDFGVHDRQAIARETIKAGVIAGIMLALVYFATSYIGAICSGVPGLLTETETGAGILSYAIQQCFGPAGQIIAGLIFLIACFNVCCGLLSSCAEYFHKLMPKIGYKLWLFGFAVFSFVISSAGLYRILSFSFPVLKVMCPIAIAVIIFGLLKKRQAA